MRLYHSDSKLQPVRINDDAISAARDGLMMLRYAKQLGRLGASKNRSAGQVQIARAGEGDPWLRDEPGKPIAPLGYVEQHPSGHKFPVLGVAGDMRRDNQNSKISSASDYDPWKR